MRENNEGSAYLSCVRACDFLVVVLNEMEGMLDEHKVGL